MFITLDKSYDVRHTTYRVNDKIFKYTIEWELMLIPSTI
jgi:hypothetical protein